jgi:hypothetical protein
MVEEGFWKLFLTPNKNSNKTNKETTKSQEQMSKTFSETKRLIADMVMSRLRIGSRLIL